MSTANHNGPKGNLANWQHATRLFVDKHFIGNYDLSPRFKFLFYVYFDIDHSVHRNTSLASQHTIESGMLAKTVALPNFNFDVEVANQYNRKKVIYKKIDYQQISITFHDDNLGVINSLWSAYYDYYIKDPRMSKQAFEDNHFLNGNTAGNVLNGSFGFDNEYTSPFFKSIKIYTLSRNRFIEYILINPKIVSWNHGDVMYESNSETVEATMTLAYEAVHYNSGTVSIGEPSGFASLYYDTVPSSISELKNSEFGSITGAADLLRGFGENLLNNAQQQLTQLGNNAINQLINAGNTFIQDTTTSAINSILGNIPQVKLPSSSPFTTTIGVPGATVTTVVNQPSWLWTQHNDNSHEQMGPHLPTINTEPINTPPYAIWDNE